MAEERAMRGFFESAGLAHVDGPVVWLLNNRYSVRTLVRMEEPDVRDLLDDMAREIGLRRGEKDGIRHAIKSHKSTINNNNKPDFFTVSSSGDQPPLTTSLNTIPPRIDPHIPMESNVPTNQESSMPMPRLSIPNQTSTAVRPSMSVFPTSPAGSLGFLPSFAQYHYQVFPIPQTNVTTNELNVVATSQDQKPRKKPRHKDESSPNNVDLDVGDHQVEKNGRGLQWKEHWIANLVRIRGEMHEEFSKTPRQGINLWNKVQMRLLSLCPDLDKDAEGCRKKWKLVFESYKDQKLENSNSESVTVDRCKWFHMIDTFMHDNANDACQTNSSSAHTIHEDNGKHAKEEEVALEEDISNDDNKVKVLSLHKKRHKSSSSKLMKVIKELVDKSGDIMEKIVLFEEKKVSMLATIQESIASLAKQL